MVEKDKQEALENIELIKELILRTKKEMSLQGGGWISIIWGIFCFVGVAGPRLFIPQGYWIGIWWTVLGIVGILASVKVSRGPMQNTPTKKKKRIFTWISSILAAFDRSRIFSFCYDRAQSFNFERIHISCYIDDSIYRIPDHWFSFF